MSQFDFNMNRRQQLVKKGKSVDNDVDFSGSTTSDFTNKFLAKMKDTNSLFPSLVNVIPKGLCA